MKRILIVEGNLREENQSFTDGGIKTHTESLKDSISYFTDQLDIDVVNPSSDENINEVAKDLTKYHGMIWGGSSLNIYNDTPEIRRQINFMRECQKNIKNIFAICWGMQVAVTVLNLFYLHQQFLIIYVVYLILFLVLKSSLKNYQNFYPFRDNHI